VLVGDLGGARRDALDAEVAGQVLRRDLAIAVHQDAQRLAAIVLEDQGLDDRVLVDAQRGRRRRGAAAWLPVVQVRREGHFELPEGTDRHRDRVVASHGVF
jgi:hypothetical protein